MNNKRTIWYLTCALVVLFTVIAFSPLVIPQGKSQPELWGMPYTLWTGILVTTILVVLTYVGTRVHPGEWDGEED